MQCYTPEAMGAKCSRCYLYQKRQGNPVPPELNPGARIAVVAEGPGSDEVQQGRPLIGPSGIEIMQALGSLGYNRADVSWSNSFLCRPPGNDLERLRVRMKRENNERLKEGLEPYLDPVDACRPRFISELRTFRDVITLGKTALTAITGTPRSIMDMRGMPMSGVVTGEGRYVTHAYFPMNASELVTPLRVVPTIHPSFVLRQKRWRNTFRVDLGRAIRWFNGHLTWREPQILYTPSLQQIEDFLFRTNFPFYLTDLETDAKESLLAKIRCIGVGTPEQVIVVPFLSIDGVTRFYPTTDFDEVTKLFERFFTARDKLKAGHNFGYYDRVVVEQELGVSPLPLVDSILYHRAVESELPHNLGYVGSMYTDVMDAWKADHTAVNAQTDEELWRYNAIDVVVNARAMQPLVTLTTQRNLNHAVDVHHQIQEVCAGMHTNGMFIDQHRRRWHDQRLKIKAHNARQKLRMIIDDPEFNPNSRGQVSEILFDRWGMTPDVIYENDPAAAKKIRKAFTAGGEPSTGDDHLRAMLLYTKDEQQKLFVQGLRQYRGAVKLRGTNIIPLRPFDEPYFESDDLQVNADTEEGATLLDEYDPSNFHDDDSAGKSVRKRMRKDKEKKQGLTLGDRRVHPHFNAHVATSQRLSSSGPNAQNWNRLIRDIVCAQTMFELGGGALPEEFDRAIISADADQLELRFAAALAGAARYLEIFAAGGDPHRVTCELLYGNDFRNASEDGQKRMRDFAKRFSYAVLYRATAETVNETLASSENDAGELIFPWLTLKVTREMMRKWLGGVPEFEAWWEKDLTEYRAQRYLLEPVLGWRRDFLDGEDMNEIANFKCQAGGSAIIHLATIEFLKYAPFNRWGPGTGLIQQGHDALVAEVPATHKPYELEKDKAGFPRVKKWCPPKCKCITEQARQALQECMTVQGHKFGLPVTFTASAKAGFRWSEV